MISKLRQGYIKASCKEVEAFVRDAEDMVNRYGWEEREVHPYSFPVKIKKILNDLRDYDRCTSGSQEYLISLANGLADIMNKWEEHEKAPKIKVRSLKDGAIHEVEIWMAKMLIEDGSAVEF